MILAGSRPVLGWLFACLLLSCGVDSSEYSARFQLNDSTVVCVPVHYGGADDLAFVNGDEVISLQAVKEGQYLVPVFGGAVNGAWKGDVFKGSWVDSLRSGEYKIPVTVQPEGPFPASTPEGFPEKSSWLMSIGMGESQYSGELLLSVGPRQALTGTVMTATGDYRFLSGGISEDGALRLQTFDGAHLFLFTAQWSHGQLTNGHFYSGSHWHTLWSAESLPEQSAYQPQTTEVQVGPLVFCDASGACWDSLSWSGYDAVIVDIMGTWCPNCMDESRLLRTLTEGVPGVKVLSLAFERGDDSLLVRRRIARFKSELGIPWDILHGGVASKRVAEQAVQQLDTVVSFPTTIFHDPQSGRTWVHSGFSGPATGDAHRVEAEAFQAYLTRCLGDG